MMVKIGIIGGSGLDNPDILKEASDTRITTIYGEPSSKLKEGKINGIDVVLLARHGREHTIPPTQVNFRANIDALKKSGCTHIIATTAVGSLKDEIGIGHLVILDQFIDFTRQRKLSFFEEFRPHRPIHPSMAEPFDAGLRKILIRACSELELNYHKTGTVITIEGPRFSTKAESNMFRIWGADVINMSISTECALANEAGIPYAAIAISTDYDCWKDSREPVTWEQILDVFKENVDKVTCLLKKAVPMIR